MATNHVQQLLLTIIPQEHRWKLVLFQRWDSIIGTLKDKVKIEKIQNDALFLSVSHPSWAQELLMLSGLLKRKINNILQEERIKVIRFSTTSFKPTVEPITQSSLFMPIPPSEAPVSVTLTHKERKTLEGIASDDLRSALEQFCVRVHRTNKKRTGDEGENKKKKTTVRS